MKKILVAFVSMLAVSAYAESHMFVGAGNCYIQSLPCKDGTSISCSAQGLNGGYCTAEKDWNYFTLTCVAFGAAAYGTRTSTVVRRCKR